MDSQTPLHSKPGKHHFIPLAITIVAFILIVVIGIYTVLSYQKKPAESPEQLTAQQENKAYSFPRLTVDKWNIEKSAATSPTSSTATVYNLNSKYSKTDFNGLLFNFFAATSTDETDKSLRAYSDRNGSSLLYMQKDTGSFLYKSTEGFPISSGSGALDESKRIIAFAQDTLGDDTLASFATYGKKSNPGVTYYELHRDWNRLGYPLYNLFGILNLKDTSLRGLSLYEPTNYVEPDSDIINSSDKTDGFKRPNDFNTVTIGVRSGKIIDVVSNLRLFTRTSSKPVTDKLISYNDAVKKLTNNEYSKLYTSPAGEGVVDREKMYPQNKASINEATVTESAIAYLEELPGTEQEVLAPYYIFRGTATLSTGYRVTFVATVPAIARNVLGTSTSTLAQFDSTQKQGTLEFEEVTATRSAPAPAGSSQQDVPQLPPPNQLCEEDPQSVNDLYNTQIDDTTGTTFGQFDVQPPGDIRATSGTGWYGPQWFAVSAANHDINQLNTIIDSSVARLQLKRDELGSQDSPTSLRDFDSLLNEWESQATSCPLRLTGRSPSLFIYTQLPTTVSVTLGSNITYLDPPSPTNSWTITTPHDYLYYEYARIPFKKPVEGWNINRRELVNFSTKIALKLGLNTAESERLIHELRNASQDVHSDRLFIGLVDRAELTAQLPLTMSPRPDSMYRIHFHISPATLGHSNPPTLQPITRTAYTVVELGATN